MNPEMRPWDGRRGLALLALVVAVSLAPAARGADPPADPFTLDVAAAQGKTETALPLPDNGVVPLRIIRQADDATTSKAFSLLTSGCQDASGAPVTCTATVDGQSGNGQASFAAGQRSLATILSVRPVPALGKVTGVLTLIADGQPAISWRLALQRPITRNATLVLDQNVRSVNITCPLCGCDRADLSVVTATIREKSAVLPLERVSARMDQVAKAPASGFDLARNIAFTFDDGPASNFTATGGDEAAKRRVEAAGQGTVKLRLQNLEPGDYSATLRFQAVNSVDDDGQKLTLNIAVKHHWLWAALDLLLAILVSFVTTKVVAARRDRLTLRARIDAIDTTWFGQEPPTMLIVWAAATLRLAEDLLKKTRLAVPATVEQRITDVSNLVPYLARIRALRRGFADDHLPDWVNKRAMEVMEARLAAFGNPPFDAATLKKVDAVLTELEGWLPAWEEPYRASVVAAANALLAEVDPREVADAKQSQVIGDLQTSLAQELQATPSPPPVKLDRDYARLLVLWKRRHVPDVFKKLVQDHLAGKGVEDLFKVADDEAWESLKRDYENMTVAGPVPDVQAYEPFQLSVTTANTFLPTTYLFKHGLRFKWKLPLPGKKKSRSTLMPETTEPMVIQFSPDDGKLSGQLTIQRDGDVRAASHPGDPKTITVTVTKSKTVKIFQSFEGVELISLLFAAAFGLVSGLLMYYVKPTSFGSGQDYLTLFLWGAAVDQSKNALQLLQGK